MIAGNITFILSNIKQYELTQYKRNYQFLIIFNYIGHEDERYESLDKLIEILKSYNINFAHYTDNVLLEEIFFFEDNIDIDEVLLKLYTNYIMRCNEYIDLYMIIHNYVNDNYNIDNIYWENTLRYLNDKLKRHEDWIDLI